jgi:hypothetical protein
VLTVNPAATSIAVGLSPSTITYGQSATISATVTSSAGTPGGTVTFYLGSVGGYKLGTATLSGGTASINVGGLPAGPRWIFASYTPADGNYMASQTPTQTVLTVNPAATAISVGLSPSTVVYGQQSTISATVTSSAGVPTGTVTFYLGSVGGFQLGTATLLSGTATLNVNNLPVGPRWVFASYSGDGNFSTTQTPSQTVLTVNPDDTMTSVSSSAGTTTLGQSVTFTATVTANGPGSGVPTGTVNFFDLSAGGAFLGSGTLSNGAATLTISSLSGGSHTIGASYGGESRFNTSSGSVVQTVQVVPVSLAAFFFPTTPIAGSPFTLTVVALDAFGNPVTNVTSQAVLTVTSVPFGGALTGNMTAGFASNGSAQFNLTGTLPGSYSVRITVGNVVLNLTFATGRQT